ncbi:MAG: arginine deiminase [Draconibacterium sp.]|nr:arginine deiminase [Draconibacterium sp.]
MKTSINSEIGKLDGVIIHTPGSEVENMTPENAERALYSDILNLSVASEEYAQLAGVLKSVTKVFDVKELLSELLENENVKNKLIRKICTSEDLECNTESLLQNSATQLTNLLIEGVVLEKNNLTNYLNKERFSVRPLHNMFFTRDSAMGMNEKMLIGKMANRVRERESIIMEAIFNNHPNFETTTINPGAPQSGIAKNLKSTIEGGDFQVARDDIFVIGTGVRTSTQGIDFIIENIKLTKSEPHHIIVQELPSTPESFIHLDMVFTFLNTDSCMIYEPVIYKTKQLRTIHIQIENRKVTKIEEVANIPTALKNLGMDLQPINCGGNNDSWIQEREQWHSGANFFAFAPGKIIGYERNVNTVEALNNSGFEVLKATDVINRKVLPGDYEKCVVTIAGSELARGGGGARCMTMPVRRAKVEL